MTDALVHRGPDDFGCHSRPGLALGFRRLAFNDLENGNQPHFSEDKSIVSVCNGEIFNHRELRAALEARGHRFRSRGDTEVLVHLYQEYGPALTDHLDGQFAFALHDSARDRLLLVRDHVGVVPLFYTVAAGDLLFASEIKALLRHPAVNPGVDLRGLDQILALPGLVSPQVMFTGIRALAPGEMLIAERGTVRTVRYWDLDYPLASDLEPLPEAGLERELEAAAAATAGTLVAAVAGRGAADVPVDLYLSGGLDSSLIATLAATGRPDREWASYSAVFPDHDIDESPYARQVADRLGLRHHEVPIRDLDLATELGNMVRHAESPVRESYNVCSLLLSRAVREQGSTAVLTGEGADELFGGYPGYRFDQAGFGGTRLTGLDAELERETRMRMWGVDIGYEVDHGPAQEFRRELYSADVADALDDFGVTGRPLVDAARLAGRHPLHQRSYLDMHLRLADHLLGDHGDRMSLANGVELRFPFLARAVVDQAVSLHPRLMVAFGEEKAVLRRVARGRVPAGVLARPKYGFRGLTSSDLLAADTGWFAELLSPGVVRRQGYFDPDTVTALVRRARVEPVHPHLEVDYLMVVATFALFVEEFGLPCLN